MGVLLLSILMSIFPLVLALYLLLFVEVLTVDGLFTALILVTISGVFGLNVLLELKDKGLLPGFTGRSESGEKPKPAAPARIVQSAEGANTCRGLVEEVLFFEAGVGQPNKSIVTLSSDGNADRNQVVLVGDLRNALPRGKRVEITYRAQGGINTLLSTREV